MNIDPISVASVADTIALAESTYRKLLNFIYYNEKVYISNKEFMDVFKTVVKCADSPTTDESLSIKKKNGEIIANEVLLYNWVVQQEKDFLQNQISELLKKDNLDMMLETFTKNFDNILIYIHWINKFFDYLNRFYLKGKKSTLVREFHILVKTEYFQVLIEKLVQIANLNLEKARNDEPINDNQLIKMINAFLIMSYSENIDVKKNESGNFYWIGEYESTNGTRIPTFYKDNLENGIYKHLIDFYAIKIKNDWSKENTPTYVSLATKTLIFEEKLAERFYPESKNFIIKGLEKVIILDMATQLVNNESSGVYHMLEKGKVDDLENLFLLFSRVPESFVPLAKNFQDYIEKSGKIFNKDENLVKNPIDYIKKVILLKTENDNLVKSVFKNNLDMEKARDIAFKNFFNDFERSSKFLAIYSDNELKRGIKGLSEEEIESSLSSIAKFFQYLYHRDAFLQEYTKYLCSRLLNDSSLSSEAEKEMLTKLKTECGQSALMKIIKMREDIDESKSTSEEYRNYCNVHKKAMNFSFNLKVLTGGCWPEFPTMKAFSFPPQIKKFVETFESYYKTKHNDSRFLTWIINEGNAEISANFGENRKFQLIVTNIQLALLFNLSANKNKTFEMLISELGVPKIALTNALENLINLKIIIKFDEEKDNYSLSLNREFNHQSKRLLCNLAPKKGKVMEEKKENANEANALKQERDYLIDAAVVRVMKSRKKLKLNEIINDVVQLLLLFRPQPGQIKTRIESLIERGYMKRDEEEMSAFIYLP